MLKKIILSSVYILVTLFVDSAEAINIAQDRYTIVVSKNANKVVDFAAKELQFYIEKTTGKKLSVKKDNQTIQNKKLILVGPSKYNNLQINSKVPEAFAIKTIKNNLYLLGDDKDADGGFYCRGKAVYFNCFTSKKGTLFAVYTFLEKYYGVRWFWPGKSGEVAPKITDISLPDIDIVEEPDFIIRHPWLECCSKGAWKPLPQIFYNSEYPLWYMRNKLGKGLPGSSSHSWAGYLTNKHFKEHPEYYA